MTSALCASSSLRYGTTKAPVCLRPPRSSARWRGDERHELNPDSCESIFERAHYHLALLRFSGQVPNYQLPRLEVFVDQMKELKVLLESDPQARVCTLYQLDHSYPCGDDGSNNRVAGYRLRKKPRRFVEHGQHA